MKLVKIESSWYADGMEAVMRLRLEGLAPGVSYVVDVTRPCCERFVHPPREPEPDGALICILPRESFETSEMVRIFVTTGGRASSEVVWQGYAVARIVQGEPQVEVVRNEEQARIAAA
jgi:hypothetical protein